MSGPEESSKGNLDDGNGKSLPDLGFDISPEFIEENKRLNLGRRRPKFAPFTKAEREMRRKEVYRLHFDHGISARRIAEMIKDDRNTINNDIQLLYRELRHESDINLDDYVNKQILRLESVHSRLIGYLHVTTDIQTKLMIERQLAEIAFKVLTAAQKFTQNKFVFYDAVLNQANRIAHDKKQSRGYTSLFEAVKVSKKSRREILRILNKEGMNKGE